MGMVTYQNRSIVISVHNGMISFKKSIIT